tara:strand:+ start:523 stop:951 length:429 start_codon:yes stop_codon:yes gene_type:complete
MSHNTTIQTQLDSQSNIEKALTELGISYQVGEGLTTRSTYRSAPPVKADITFRANNGDTVGFVKKKDGSFECVGDFYSGVKATHPNGLTERLSQDRFVKRMTQMSAVVKVKDAIRRRYGIRSLKYEVQSSGKIRLRITPRNV